ncbi:hypothetical protein CLAFUW4_07141 [Fulvia fulva]|uniref:RNase MRP protein 1 RNA binding domain-containing protein n=1 Tax=Passalora fulva TaxID=5499 RepID=A0A9Q8PA34_PASFU|nr:uncharacterized protein CLAFUR5_07275 [Fulvia fulva]KAK4621460.1 hypothetical protein CLAFUR4_07150 [Fulvia fulva]KAK4622500.1 hypothetical protein CLAFUR0_07148 [Fulvia fulva]UJO18661.1 hypothetical protein CLAFUR5_07275 [Fulvia fulva]WPV16289.1 hypothetical protein CLAFUW4_07141 [Fulvia fulva]WPV30991.1 hypothetical protein CLAFUW7_07142 [Fulvia fulva]
MADVGLIDISHADQAELRHLADLLHLFHHRNKNQHRRSVWWRHFSIFRKQLSALVNDSNRIDAVALTNLARAKKKAQDAQIAITTSKRILFWRDTMVAKWQHAFSQLIADGRFSVLGLVLLAALSQVCQIVGITADLEEMGQAKVEKVLEEFGRDAWGAETRQQQNVAAEDLGEVIQREEVPNQVDVGELKSRPEERTMNATSARVRKATATSNNKPSKKKRKKGNAIDDIFG